MSLKDQLPSLTDQRLTALAFNAWRITEGGDERRGAKAARLRPLVKAEMAARVTSKTAAKKSPRRRAAKR